MNGFNRHLAEVLGAYREGSCPVLLDYQNTQARALITLGDGWRVRPDDELLHRLRELLGAPDAVQLEFREH
jgi:DNA polymerase-3 subunit alpha